MIRALTAILRAALVIWLIKRRDKRENKESM